MEVGTSAAVEGKLLRDRLFCRRLFAMVLLAPNVVHSLSVSGRVEDLVSILGTSSCRVDPSLELDLYAIYRVLLVSL